VHDNVVSEVARSLHLGRTGVQTAILGGQALFGLYVKALFTVCLPIIELLRECNTRKI